MHQLQHLRPRRSAADPNLTILPAISAPIDEGRLIPKPPISAWDRLMLIGALTLLAAAVLFYAFVHASDFH